MSLRPALFLFVSLAMLGGCIPLLAQVHMELSDGSSGWVVLVNDSEKTVEAYHLSAKCMSEGRRRVGMEASYDALDSAGNSRSGPGKVISGIFTHSDVAEPGTRMVSMEGLVPQPSGCFWDAEFDAVIYADGSYEGEEMKVRSLQARRDGVAAGVKYWADRLAQQAADKDSRETIRADAERLKDEDLKKITNRCRKLECEYWRGIFQVDINVAANTRPSENSPPLDGYGGIIQTYARHEKKIEADVALKKLDAVFPLAALAEPGDQFQVLQVPRN